MKTLRSATCEKKGHWTSATISGARHFLKVFDKYEKGTFHPQDRILIWITELENKILHWGENIVVVEPPELKERIMERTRKMVKNYNSVH